MTGKQSMLLATFQPLEPTNRKRSFRAFEEVLGYYPTFCFAARTVEEFQFYCWTATPNTPEKVIIFNCDDYVAFDAVKWCQLFGNDCSVAEKLAGDDIRHIFEDVNAPYAEFVVPDISASAIVDEFNLIDLIDRELMSVDDEAMRMVAEAAKHNFEAMLFHKNISRHPRDREEQKAVAHCAKAVFGTMLSGIAYRAATLEPTPIERVFPFSHADVYADDPDDARYIIPAVTLRKKIYDTPGGGTHEEFDEMVSLMTSYQEKMLSEMTSAFFKADRNESCPCGSGKKFKKCHGSPEAPTIRLFEPFHQDDV